MELTESKQLLKQALEARGVVVGAMASYAVICRTAHGNFSLSFMPGNCRTLISHGVVIDEACRGKGYGTADNKLREEAARAAGVTLILATVRDDNAPEIHILEKLGWSRLTQNQVTRCSLWGKQLL